MIELLKRPEGATVEQIAAATGWQHHTIRGAISGALKKKLGLTVEATRTREVGPNKTGAKGSATTYRIRLRSAPWIPISSSTTNLCRMMRATDPGRRVRNVQAAARVFIFQALSAWTVLEETGQTEQLAPDFEAWLRKILEDEIPYVGGSPAGAFPSACPKRVGLWSAASEVEMADPAVSNSWPSAWSRAATTASCAASQWSPAMPTMTLPP